MFSKTNKNSSLIIEIQQEAIARDRSVANLLRKAKVAAIKLRQTEAVSWIDNELDGYDCPFDDLPGYRQAHGTLRVKNPYHGLQPFFFQDEETELLFTRAPFTDGIATLESLSHKEREGGQLIYSMSPTVRNYLLSAMDVQLEPVLLLSVSQIETILNKVTSLVLDWSLELESRGITGEGMTFSTDDQRKASEATQTIIAQNIGNIGNASENASTRIQIESSGTQQIDQRKLDNFIDQAKNAVELLPSELFATTQKTLEEIEASNSDIEKREKLQSLKNILEGATGNIAAQGIIQLISALL